MKAMGELPLAFSNILTSLFALIPSIKIYIITQREQIPSLNTVIKQTVTDSTCMFISYLINMLSLLTYFFLLTEHTSKQKSLREHILYLY